MRYLYSGHSKGLELLTNLNISLAKEKPLFYNSFVQKAYKGGEYTMAEVKVGENESIESALRRFKKKIQKAGILSEVKKRERYEKPSVKRKRKSEAARKRKV